MQYETISYEIAEDVAIITLSRADVMNALNTQMRAEITHAVQEAGRAARVVVLTGSGRAFCSGQDLGDRETAANMDLERVLRDEYEPMLNAITDCPVPTIAAVNGAAAGAGANLALVHDVVIATESAFFMQAFTRIGLIPDAGGTWALPRQMGLAKAMGAALFFSGKASDAAKAYAQGLAVDRLAARKAWLEGGRQPAEVDATGGSALKLAWDSLDRFDRFVLLHLARKGRRREFGSAAGALGLL